MSTAEHKVLVDAVMNSNLDDFVIYEQNRTNYLKQIGNEIIKSIAQVNTEIEAEIKE